MRLPFRILLAIAFTAVPLLSSVSVTAEGPADADVQTAKRSVAGSTIKSIAPANFVFSVYPVGGNGELGNVGATDADATLAAIHTLRGQKAMAVHLFTAWSWYNEADLDAEIARYTNAGIWVTLTIKYSPPEGRAGDIDGFVAFVRTVVTRHGKNPFLFRFAIGNEGNITWGNPGSSDGPFAGVNDAVVRGTVAARKALNRIGSRAQVGVNYAVTGGDGDAAYLRSLATKGGKEFRSSVGFLGLNVYPGLWPEGSGDPYADMTAYLHGARTALTAAGFDQNVTIDVLENGFPTADEQDQVRRLDLMVRAVIDNRVTAGISGYSWFGLLDADSSSDNRFAHYGLLRSDLSPKPAFDRYRQLIAETGN